MAKKKRFRKITSFGIVEGNREQIFIDYLIEVYQPSTNGINFSSDNSKGGNASKIIKKALDNSHRDRSFAMLDNDFGNIEHEILIQLANNWSLPKHILPEFLSCEMGELQANYNQRKKNPILIISKPVCMEGFILNILGIENLPTYISSQRHKQIGELKIKLNNLLGHHATTDDQLKFYRDRLPVAVLENKRAIIPELNLLIQMITKS